MGSKYLSVLGLGAVDKERDLKFLKKAFQLAKVRRGFCAPNPSVGAVVTKGGELLSSGFHWGAGHPHAEVEALRGLGSAAQGATLYVSLEPCCHVGKTPPCVEAIRESGIARVVYGFQDPNPKVNGGGEARLRAWGISCEGLHSPGDEGFYEAYAHWTHTGRPWVRFKLAMSLDGKIAAAGGAPVRLTGTEADQFTHACRMESDAILTSAATIIADDPQLNVRREGNPDIKKPIYVLDRVLALKGAKVFETAEKLTLFCLPGASEEKRAQLRQRGFHCIEVRQSLELGDVLDQMLDRIGEDGVHSLWIEGGARLGRALLQQRLLQRALFYVCPVWLGSGAVSANLEGFEAWQTGAVSTHWRSFGKDTLLEMVF